MVLDQMNMENFQSVGGYKAEKARGHKKNRPRSLRLIRYIKNNRRHTKRNRRHTNRNNQYTKGYKKKGGTALADISVPASLLLLNQFFKNRKTQENKKIKFNKSKKSKK